MNKLIVIGSLFAVSACTPASQQKVNTVLDLAECKAKVLSPYVEYFTSEQFLEAVAGKEYFDILEAAGATPAEVEATVEALKACHK